LALILEETAHYQNLVVEAGHLMSNAQGLGYTSVDIKSGVLTILQTNAGTLYARISGPEVSQLFFDTQGYLNNGSGTPIRIGENNAGTVYVYQDQPDFYGNVVAQNGVTVQLGVVQGDAFAKSASFRLQGGESMRDTTLRINGNDQRIRNFSGDSHGRVSLGEGTLTLIQAENTVFNGRISGVGTLIKDGEGTFSLTGANDYSGATVVKQGKLALTVENAAGVSSALVLKNGATVQATAPQRFGALFGEANSTVDIGENSLTIGFSDLLYESTLSKQRDLLNAGYLSTYTNADDVYNLKDPGTVNSPAISTNEKEGTTVGYLRNPVIGIENAGTLDFAGRLVGSGNLVKIGKERLTLSGRSPAYTGEVHLEGGVLRVNGDGLSASAGIWVDTPAGAADDFFEINANALEHHAFNLPLQGTGDVHKTGAGEVTLGSNTSYKGDTVVDQGRLVVTNIAALPPGTDQDAVSRVRVYNSGALVFDWSGSTPAEYRGAVGARDALHPSTGGIEKRGSGEIILSGALEYGHVTQNLSAEGKSLLALSARPAGSILSGDGTIQISGNPADVEVPEGPVLKTADGTLYVLPKDAVVAAAGSKLYPSGEILQPDGQPRLSLYGAVVARPAGGEIWLNGVLLDDRDFIAVPDGTLTDGTGIYNTQDTVVVRDDGTGALGTYGESYGMTSVQEGTLRLDSIPKIPGRTAGDLGYASNFEIAEGATLQLNLARQDGETQGVIYGSGRFVKEGEYSLTFGHAQDDFTGYVEVRQSEVRLAADNVFQNTREVFMAAGTDLYFKGEDETTAHDQLFHFLNGDAGAVIHVDGASLTLDVAANAGETRRFDGLMVGGGTFIKAGEGILTLWRPEGETNILDRVWVREGVLQASPGSLGEAAVHIEGDAGKPLPELRFYAKEGELQVYSRPVTGTGTIGKGGPGTVWLDGSNSIPSGDFLVTEGRLVLDDTRTVGAVPGALVRDGATFQLNFTQTSATPIVLGSLKVRDYAPGEHGNFAISGPKGSILEINAMPLGYTGTTELVGGVTLQFNNRDFTTWASIPKLVGGLAGGANAQHPDAPTLNLAGVEALEIIQNVNGVFAGNIFGSRPDGTGATGLVIKGPGRLNYTGPDGKGKLLLGDPNKDGTDSDYKGVGTVTVDGENIAGNGNFQVGVENIHEINIIRNGTLYIYNPGDTPVRYEGKITNFDRNTGADTAFNLAFTGKHLVNAALTGQLPPGRKAESFVVDTASTLTVEISPGGNALDYFREDGRTVVAGEIPARRFVTAAEDSVLEISVRDGAPATLVTTADTAISGKGSLRKIGDGALLLNGVQQYTGATLVSAGALRGDFTVAGNLVVASGGTLAPGAAIGIQRTLGNFDLQQGGTLEIGINGTANDVVEYVGTATLNGTLRVVTEGKPLPRGEKYLFLNRVDATGTSVTPNLAIGASFNVSVAENAENAYYILVGPGLGVGTPYEELGKDGPALLVGQQKLAKVPGYNPHKGLGGFLNVLDDFASLEPLKSGDGQVLPPALLAVYQIGHLLNTTPDRGLNTVVNNLSPLGYGSLVAMPAFAASAASGQLHAHLEQRRYDRAAISEYNRDWELYVTASGNFAENGKGGDDPVFNFNTYGGTVGADNQFSKTNLAGVALEYTNGKSTLHNGGGSISMNAVRATGYWSHIFNDWFFLDSGAAFGYATYDARRNTALGSNKASPDGWNAGVFATAGTIFPIQSTLHLNPYLGLEYNHYDIGAFTEKGSGSRLKVDGFGYDSLRAKIGTGLSWFVGKEWDLKWKFTLDVAYAHELLDTDADINARFSLAGTKAHVSAATLPADVVQFGPTVTLSLDERSSIFLSYRLEIGFGGGTYNNVNLGFRTRF
jgi:autotransporter-associated beta strand protein